MGSMSYGPVRGVQGGQRKDDLFSKVDANQDGTLDESEMASFSDKMSEMTGRSSDAAKMMALFDSDQDGSVTESEFNAAGPNGPPPPPMMGGNGENPFSSIDEDGDGSLNESELAAFTEKMSEITGSELDSSEFLSSLDTDGNGSVSEDEFKAGKPQGPPPPPPGVMPPDGMGAAESGDETGGLLGSLDSDGDGTVSEDEFKLGMNSLILEYMNQSIIPGSYGSSSGSVLNVEA
jgi:Ca2+-binding EF-hand superfamily protein